MLKRSPTRCPRAVLLATAALAVSPLRGAGLDGRLFHDGLETRCGEIVFSENFSQADGPWPSRWLPLGGSVNSAVITSGEGRFRPNVSGYSLARLGVGAETRDVEVRLTMTLEDAAAQGVGFYVRQNGGHLNLTTLPGSGYAVFVEGTFRGMAGVGVWREENGNEIQIAHSPPGSPAPTQGVPYRVRLQVIQSTPTTTLLQAKTWPAASAEPAGWQVSASNAQADLQGRFGGVAVDSWNVATSGTMTAYTRIDDIEVESICASP